MIQLMVVGMGPFPWPGEKRRMRKAEEDARRMMEIVKEIEDRSKDD